MPTYKIAVLSAVAALAMPLISTGGALAQSNPATLAGVVTSDRDGPMEGVLVSAKKQGSTITVTVVSNDKGEYAFPAGRLEPGQYQIGIRAAGYALDGSGAATLTASQPAKADLKLKPAPVTTAELTNSEWLTSAPGPDELKRGLLNCTDCHSVQRIFESKHTSEEFMAVFERMGGYYPGASDMQPQRLNGEHRRPAVNPAMAQAFSTYLAALNLSAKPQHGFELKLTPRAKGRATRVIITEYDLPRKEIQPHDVIVDADGGIWYSHFGEQFLSKLDPKTGKVTDYPIPVLKPDHPKGTLDLEVDHNGYIWVGMMYQGGMARFDRKTEQFRVYPVPKEWQTDATQQSHFSVAGMKADGKVWVKNSDRSQVMKLDPETGKYENLGSFKIPSNGRPIGIYGIYADQQNNAYILEFGNGGIGKIDAKTGAMAFYPTPTPFSRARRGRVDSENRLWFAEFGSNGVAMFDPKTEKITEWKKPLEWESPYDVVADRFGTVWEVNESSDRLGRLNPKTGEWVNYPLPRYSNFRRVFVDDRTPQVAVWVGNDHAAQVVKLEPLD
ncbi:carboxypeptidase regulatory-like domain-containing protein [Rhodoplanes sp. Z2-YC6860]|uniref:carboxypeptidase regulatory-like domain-containing protein n=1 Tax=Rhodoplanes sp. Z2-YC6860 TaxID=674703 RepID=UPI00078D1B5C|nr:carboxypeptidase regulatory-like domain-containing protein [Rhodoplanes sp. Z2-YC6860]AMN42089.1 streptogramin lyase-related transmembrane protein [Rhodoplanes sp. Z2-YC6860]